MPQSLDLLHQVYDWSAVDVLDIDDQKYNLAKKLSGVRLGRVLEV